MAEENLAELLRSINLRLERMEKKNEESEIEKQKQDTRMDVMADMLLKATRKIGEIENEDSSSGNNYKSFDEDRGLKIDLPEFNGGHDSE
ncbi:unnamed protein product [Amaranthus hypochondriacus]